jgi:hypothetical protein
MKLRSKIAASAILVAALTGAGVGANAAISGNPQYQTGAVHSCTTNGQAAVTTTDGGYTWYYNGNSGSPQMQYGVVHSFTTNGNADVLTFNGGVSWEFDNNGRLFCSPPR